MPKIYIAADHAGYELKQALVPYIGTLGYEVEDLGAHERNPDDDYPDFIIPVAERVAAEAGSIGVVIGGSGQGEAMAANRVPGVRAAVFYGYPAGVQVDALGNELDVIVSARTHNNANVLSLGARFMSIDEAKEAVKAFLSTPFSGDERHVRRLQKF